MATHIDDDTLGRVHREDQNKIKRTGQKLDHIEAAEAEKVRQRYAKVREKVTELVDQKHELLRALITKAELAELAKKSLRAGRQDTINVFLEEHLRGCQGRRSYPFDQKTIRLYFDETHAWRLAFFCFTEEDIDRVISSLPEVGLSSETRDGKIAEIDKEIAKMEASLDKDFKDRGGGD